VTKRIAGSRAGEGRLRELKEFPGVLFPGGRKKNHVPRQRPKTRKRKWKSGPAGRGVKVISLFGKNFGGGKHSTWGGTTKELVDGGEKTWCLGCRGKREPSLLRQRPKRIATVERKRSKRGTLAEGREKTERCLKRWAGGKAAGEMEMDPWNCYGSRRETGVRNSDLLKSMPTFGERRGKPMRHQRKEVCRSGETGTSVLTAKKKKMKNGALWHPQAQRNKTERHEVARGKKKKECRRIMKKTAAPGQGPKCKLRARSLRQKSYARPGPEGGKHDLEMRGKDFASPFDPGGNVRDRRLPRGTEPRGRWSGEKKRIIHQPRELGEKGDGWVFAEHALWGQESLVRLHGKRIGGCGNAVREGGEKRPYNATNGRNAEKTSSSSLRLSVRKGIHAGGPMGKEHSQPEGKWGAQCHPASVYFEKKVESCPVLGESGKGGGARTKKEEKEKKGGS